jgi:hypothetical protein
VTGIFDTITESVFGQPDPNTWRPLPLSTFFSEGWNEAWVPSPSGSGGAPRQGWINAADGNFSRGSEWPESGNDTAHGSMDLRGKMRELA